jgi:hypothetical protein
MGTMWSKSRELGVAELGLKRVSILLERSQGLELGQEGLRDGLNLN